MKPTPLVIQLFGVPKFSKWGELMIALTKAWPVVSFFTMMGSAWMLWLRGPHGWWVWQWLCFGSSASWLLWGFVMFVIMMNDQELYYVLTTSKKDRDRAAGIGDGA